MNVGVLRQFCRSGSYMFDVGGNIGLIAIPILRLVPGCRVVSLEPSPNALSFLQRTVAQSPFGDRWSVIPKGASDRTGTAEFSVADPPSGMFDGFKATNRVCEVGRVLVQVTTLDSEWKSLGQPDVSTIKIDVEGAELAVLNGAKECIAVCRPSILVEWNRRNLAAYDCRVKSLLTFAKEIEYGVYSLPHMAPTANVHHLVLQMSFGESFVLLPNCSAGLES
ncbi:MAG: FkbM family methyltransferase [Chthoniobacterales bacterium]